MKISSTQQICASIFSKSNQLVFSSIFFSLLFLSSPTLSAFDSPTTGTESLRTNLYLFNAVTNTRILADGVLTEYNNRYSDGVMLEDAYKFTNITENLGMTRHGITLAVERRPIIASADTIFFRLWKTTQRFYQLEFIPINLNHPGMTAMLQDNYLGTNTPLSLTDTTRSTFSVNSNTGSSSPARFRIIYSTSVITSPLPVTFTSVKGALQNKQVLIAWDVENEINISAYQTEHSVDGSKFSSLNTTAVAGLNNSSNSYSYTHIYPATGNNFYRIRSIDKDGEIKFSQVIKVVHSAIAKTISLFPNPVSNGKINLQFAGQPAGMYAIRISNHIGQVLSVTKVAFYNISSSHSILLPQQLRSGIYHLEIRKPDASFEVHKVVVN